MIILNAETVDIVELSERYEAIRKQENLLKKEKENIAKTLKEYAINKGNKDSKGSSWVQQGGYTFGNLAKTSIKLNQEKALSYITEHKPDLVAECIDVIQVVSDAKLETLFKEGRLTMEELEALMDVKTTYQISVKKDVEEKEEAIVDIKTSPRVKKVLRKVLK